MLREGLHALSPDCTRYTGWLPMSEADCCTRRSKEEGRAENSLQKQSRPVPLDIYYHRTPQKQKEECCDRISRQAGARPAAGGNSVALPVLLLCSWQHAEKDSRGRRGNRLKNEFKPATAPAILPSHYQHHQSSAIQILLSQSDILCNPLQRH